VSLPAARQRWGDVEPLTDAEFRRVRDFVYGRSGLFYPDAKRFLLESRLRKRLLAVGGPGVAEYLALAGSGGDELMSLLDELTVHETSFFRNRPQLEGFRREALPALLGEGERQGRRVLRIWSAACSSGEEAYTLAMLVLETLGDEARRWDVRIAATDISRRMLERARRAEYGPYSFRGAPAYYVQKYFEIAGPQLYRVRPEARNLVEFGLLNLADDRGMGTMRGFDVVFCRNALIYFDPASRHRCAQRLADALAPGGFLFVGHAESLHGFRDRLQVVSFPGALGYRRPGPEPRG